MAYPTLSAFDNHFQQNASSSYYLIIQPTATDFRYAVYDWNTNTYIAVESYNYEQDGVDILNATQQLEYYYTQIPTLRLHYKCVNYIHTHEKSTLIPNELYDAVENERYLQLVSYFDPIRENAAVEELKYVDAHQLFSINKNLKYALEEKYPTLKHKYHGAILIDTLLKLYKPIRTDLVFLQIQTNQVEIVVLKNGKLQFYNTFPYTNKEDCIYFILDVCKHLEIDKNTTPFTLIGELTRTSDLFTSIQQYCKNTSFINRNESYNYSDAFITVPSSFLFTLFSGKSANN